MDENGPPVDETADPRVETATETFEEPILAGETPRRREGPPPITARSELPFGIVFFLLLAIVVAIFAVQNTELVSIRFITWEWDIPLAVVIIAVVAASVILDEVAGLFLRRRRRRRAAEKAELRRLREMNR
jgi:uncharacterized integral membrane protein